MGKVASIDRQDEQKVKRKLPVVNLISPTAGRLMKVSANRLVAHWQPKAGTAEYCPQTERKYLKKCELSWSPTTHPANSEAKPLFR